LSSPSEARRALPAVIRALRWSSIDFDRGLLTVERAYSLDQVLAPKSDKIRVVPMMTRLLEALQP
jgi:integrase